MLPIYQNIQITIFKKLLNHLQTLPIQHNQNLYPPTLYKISKFIKLYITIHHLLNKLIYLNNNILNLPKTKTSYHKKNKKQNSK